MGTACGSQWCLFKMHKSAFVVNIRGCLGKNLIQVWDEQITLLSSRVVRVSRKSWPPPRQRSYNSTIFPSCYLWDMTKEERSYPKKKGFNKRKTVLRMAVRIHYRHGLLHSLNRQKHFFSPLKFTTEVHTKWTSHSKTHDWTNCFVLPPLRNTSGPEEGRVRTFHGHTPLFTWQWLQSGRQLQPYT